MSDDKEKGPIPGNDNSPEASQRPEAEKPTPQQSRNTQLIDMHIKTNIEVMRRIIQFPLKIKDELGPSVEQKTKGKSRKIDTVMVEEEPEDTRERIPAIIGGERTDLVQEVEEYRTLANKVLHQKETNRLKQIMEQRGLRETRTPIDDVLQKLFELKEEIHKDAKPSKSMLASFQEIGFILLSIEAGHERHINDDFIRTIQTMVNTNAPGAKFISSFQERFGVQLKWK